MDLTNQAIVNYIGDYDYYLEKKDEMTQIYAPAQETAFEEVREVSETKLTWQQQKEEQARKRKQENELKKTEQRIEALETRDKEIDATLILPDVVYKCRKMCRTSAVKRIKSSRSWRNYMKNGKPWRNAMGFPFLHLHIG